METSLLSENLKRSGGRVSEETGSEWKSGSGNLERAWERNYQKTSDRTGRAKKRRRFGSTVWRGAIFGMVICLIAELATAMGIPAAQFIGSTAEQILAAIPRESIGQFQNTLYYLSFQWTADSLPVCTYAVLASDSADGQAGDVSVSDCTAVLWGTVADETDGTENSGEDGENGKDETEEDGESEGGETEEGGESEGDETEEGGESGGDDTEEGGKSGGDDTEEGGKSGGDDTEEGGENGTDDTGKEESGGEDGTGGGGEEEEELSGIDDGSTETGTVSFLMPAVTGTLYTAEALSYSFLISNFYNISSSTVVYESELNGSLLSVPLAISEVTEEPQILIYHTHSHEFFADSDTSDLSTGIVGVGEYLAELLEGCGYSVLHLTDQFDYVDGVLDRSKAYTYAAARLKEVLAEYPTIEVMIDLHRDGVDEDTRFVTEINGKSTAMIMFFNGMSRTTAGNISYLPNTNLEANLAFSLQLKVKAEAYYPGFTRKNYIKPYRYNLHLLEKSLLIEAGAQTNTLEEVMNAMEPLAVLLYMQLSGEP